VADILNRVVSTAYPKFCMNMPLHHRTHAAARVLTKHLAVVLVALNGRMTQQSYNRRDRFFAQRLADGTAMSSENSIALGDMLSVLVYTNTKKKLVQLCVGKVLNLTSRRTGELTKDGNWVLQRSMDRVDCVARDDHTARVLFAIWNKMPRISAPGDSTSGATVWQYGLVTKARPIHVPVGDQILCVHSDTTPVEADAEWTSLHGISAEDEFMLVRDTDQVTRGMDTFFRKYPGSLLCVRFAPYKFNYFTKIICYVPRLLLCMYCCVG
jgi:hypothetical protein